MQEVGTDHSNIQRREAFMADMIPGSESLRYMTQTQRVVREVRSGAQDLQDVVYGGNIFRCVALFRVHELQAWEDGWR